MKKDSGNKDKPTIKPDRTLLYIAIWKFVKGIFLLIFGLASLYIIRIDLLDEIVLYIQKEMLLEHLKIIQWVLNKIMSFINGKNLQTTGVLALCYSGVLIAEGVGVYLNKKWAEWLIVISTASLIPVEVYHFFHKPSILRFLIIIINAIIAIYLYRVLRKKETKKET